MGYLFVIPSLIGIKYLDNFLQLDIDLAEHQPSRHGIFSVWQFSGIWQLATCVCVCVYVWEYFDRILHYCVRALSN